MNEYDEALTALVKFHEQNPSVFDDFGRYQGERIWVQPSKSDSKTGRKYVHLRNINGPIARYNLRTKEITI